MATCLILGASRGIGRELARQYGAHGDRVIATCRDAKDAPALQQIGARVVAADVLAPGWAAELAAQLAGETLNVVILAAGVLGPEDDEPAAPTAEEFDAVMRTNVLAAMQLIPLLAGQLARTHCRLVVLSSRMGSIGQATDASRWLYRASKAALNSALKSASIALGPRGVVCMSLHPGWVRTDMGGASADLSVEESASAIRRVIAASNSSHNGRFLNYTGEQLEW